MPVFSFAPSRSWVARLALSAGLGLAVFAGASSGQMPNSSPMATATDSTGAMAGGPGAEALEWIFFPANPPPLGTEVAVVAATRPNSLPKVLRAFLTDPFYSQIASRLVRLAGEASTPRLLQTQEHVQLDSFLHIRAALIGEIENRTARALRLPLAERVRAFEELAAAQRARFVEMERAAEVLRAGMSRSNPWGEHRTWRLNRGSLRQPREKTFVLEFQVVRAAAYYQEGLSPGQRRLVRELAIEMNETIATKGEPAPASERFFFFSPDTTRIPLPRLAPREVQALIERYSAEKRRLKDELREAIYEVDGMLFEYTRIRRLDELAQAQSAAIESLERLAEEIRRGLVQLPDYPRYPRAPRFHPELEARLLAFAQETEQIETDRLNFVRERLDRVQPSADVVQVRATIQATVSQARSAFDLHQGERLMAHEREAEALVNELEKVLPPEDVLRLNGAADIAVRDYLERRAETDAYAEYDLATIEPGFSPEQRRLLLASAMAKLRQVELPPERQPTDAPGALFGITGGR